MIVHLIIKGNVQGVFFRATARKVAEKNNLTGWIKNKSNGDVEAIVSGTDENVRTFIEWCWNGPDKAQVEDIVINEKLGMAFKSFEVKRD
ncbi:MAG: acylphosphatase [Ginsengibacter sp.]